MYSMKAIYPSVRRPVTTVLLVLCTWAVPAAGQQAEVRASVDTSEILLGDPVHLRLEAITSPELSVRFPVYTDTISKGIDILEQKPVDSLVQPDHSILFRKEFIITGFDSGYFEIPPQPVIWRSGATSDTLFTQPIMLVVNRMPVDTSVTIYDIKGPYRAPLTFMELLPYLLAGIALAGAAIGLWWYLRRRKRRQSLVGIYRPAEPAHIIALRELEKLEAEKLWQKNHVKQYHTRLTEILRVYIEGRFEVHAMEQTTDEIMENLRTIPVIEPSLREQVQIILSLADLVKFAKYKPLAEENDRSMLQAYRFVQETRPVEPVTASGNHDNNLETTDKNKEDSITVGIHE